LVYQLIGELLPIKDDGSNIILVVSPLSSIIEDQVSKLSSNGVAVSMMNFIQKKSSTTLVKLFENSFVLENEVEDDGISTAEAVEHVDTSLVEGKYRLLFGHPESFLSAEGRSLLKSRVYQDNTRVCVIDEAHCIEFWGSDFRKDFMELAALKAILPKCPTLALTATATPKSIIEIKEKLSLNKNCSVIKASPNRKNVFLKVVKRLSSYHSFRSYYEILQPIAEAVASLKLKYPMTIVYMKLKYCSYAFKLFSSILKDPFIGDECLPTSRLFCQFHASSTSKMKKEILTKLKRKALVYE